MVKKKFLQKPKYFLVTLTTTTECPEQTTSCQPVMQMVANSRMRVTTYHTGNHILPWKCCRSQSVSCAIATSVRSKHLCSTILKCVSQGLLTINNLVWIPQFLFKQLSGKNYGINTFIIIIIIIIIIFYYYYYYYYYYSLRVFPTYISWLSFWVTASLLGSPGLFSVFMLISTML